MRHSLPNARIMVHQPSGSAGGQATDIQIQAEEIIKLKKQLNGIYVKHTKQPLAYIEARYSGDLNNELVRYLNGPNMSDSLMAYLEASYCSKIKYSGNLNTKCPSTKFI